MNEVNTSALAKSPHDLKRRLGILLRGYIRQGGDVSARHIVRTIELILGHPDNNDELHERCVYVRLLWQWKVLR